MTKTLSVPAIQNGTVIDHIAPGQTMRIVHMLGLLEKNNRVTIGLNLTSERLKLKDLIKIENHTLTLEEANEVNVFAPEATINIIKNFEVVEKVITRLPSSVKGVFECPNPRCISQSEPVQSYFMIKEDRKRVNLVCNYCEKSFDRNQVKVKI